MTPEEADCIVIGGGPAGLAAAIYLARFHLNTIVLDDGRSRAAAIPLTRNLAGFPEGISGELLLARMRRQAESFGARMIEAQAMSLAREVGCFRAGIQGMELRVRKVLLATGVINLAPDMPDDLHDRAVAEGLLRYCPVCDGYEVTDRRVGLLGTGDHALREAEFMRSFTRDVTLIAPYGRHAFAPDQAERLQRWGIAAVDGPATGYAIGGREIALMAGRQRLSFDTLYAALGTEVRAELARAAGAETSRDGGVLVDRHQMTSVEGLYAAGDVVKGLDQIGTAMGQAAIAATAMRNAICESTPLRRGEINRVQAAWRPSRRA